MDNSEAHGSEEGAARPTQDLLIEHCWFESVQVENYKISMMDKGGTLVAVFVP